MSTLPFVAQITRHRHRHDGKSRLPAKYLTRLYIGLTALLLLSAGLTSALAGSGKPARSSDIQGAAPAQSQMLQPHPQAFATPPSPTPGQPDATDPQSSSQSSVESEGVTNQNNHSVSITSNDAGTTINVNGQTSTVPANGSMDQTYSTDGNSPSTTHISVDNSSSQSTAGNSSSSHISVRSSSQVEGRSGSTDTQN